MSESINAAVRAVRAVRAGSDGILTISKSYLFFALMFLLEKPLFLASHLDKMPKGMTLSDWLSVSIHGLPMDLSIAAYFTIVPVLLVILKTFISIPVSLWNAYFALAIGLIWTITVPDIEIYGFWGTHMDAPTIFFYLEKPGDVAASFTWPLVIKNCLILIAGLAASWHVYTRHLRPHHSESNSIGSNSISIHTPPKKLSCPSSTLPSPEPTQPTLPTPSDHIVSDVASENIAFKKNVPFSKVFAVLLPSVTGAILFILARGGLSAATMNVGCVYFSQNAFLNHAAIAPVWNFLDSFNWKSDFAQQYRFMDDETAKSIVSHLVHPVPRAPSENAIFDDGGTKLLTTGRPNILLIILESFSGNFLQPLGGETGVMPNLSALFETSVAFTKIHASGTRTDSGVVAILSGYPAQPRSRIMARPDKALAIASLGKTLLRQGYDLAFYYGGDEDFANMNAYLVGNGFKKIQGEKSFPKDEVRTKWGVYDHVLYRRLLEELDDWQSNASNADTVHSNLKKSKSESAGGDEGTFEKSLSDEANGNDSKIDSLPSEKGDRTEFISSNHSDESFNVDETDRLDSTDEKFRRHGVENAPFFKVALTLTSHEPFRIPIPPRFPGNDTATLYKNSLYYADSALGDFMAKARKKPWWKNTLIILVADHGTHYPNLKIHQEKRYKIPLLWTGGAIRAPLAIDAIGSQTDLPATLLGELGIAHDDFPFSKDLLDPSAPKNAFYTFNEGFGFVDETGASAFDCSGDVELNPSDTPELPSAGDKSDKLRLQKGKAFLQRLFDDIAALTTRN